VLAEIETDKATMEVESIDEGTVAELLTAEGTEGVPVGQVIMRLSGEGEAAAVAKPPEAAAPPPAPPVKKDPPRNGEEDRAASGVVQGRSSETPAAHTRALLATMQEHGPPPSAG